MLNQVKQDNKFTTTCQLPATAGGVVRVSRDTLRQILGVYCVCMWSSVYFCTSGVLFKVIEATLLTKSVQSYTSIFGYYGAQTVPLDLVHSGYTAVVWHRCMGLGRME